MATLRERERDQEPNARNVLFPSQEGMGFGWVTTHTTQDTYFGRQQNVKDFEDFAQHDGLILFDRSS